jgi:hypothetical protein
LLRNDALGIVIADTLRSHMVDDGVAH